MDAEDPVLVALVNRPSDLEIARTKKWYRIPAKRAPGYFTQANYIAFYLTKAFGEAKWSIREYAPVKGHELVRRCDLLPEEGDHPRAGEIYYKLELGRLISLPRPIVSTSGRRLLFVWTTGGKFQQATEINDLLGKSQADDELWAGLKASGLTGERQTVVHDGSSRYRVDYWITCVEGHLGVILGDESLGLPKNTKWRALRFSEEQVLADQERCVRRILEAVRNLGGVEDSPDR